MEMMGVYIGKKHTVDIIEADSIKNIAIGTQFYKTNEVIYFAPAFLCVEKITDEEAATEIVTNGKYDIV